MTKLLFNYQIFSDDEEVWSLITSNLENQLKYEIEKQNDIFDTECDLEKLLEWMNKYLLYYILV